MVGVNKFVFLHPPLSTPTAIVTVAEISGATLIEMGRKILLGYDHHFLYKLVPPGWEISLPLCEDNRFSLDFDFGFMIIHYAKTTLLYLRDGDIHAHPVDLPLDEGVMFHFAEKGLSLLGISEDTKMLISVKNPNAVLSI